MVKAISGNLGRRCRGRRAGVRSAMHNARQGHIDKNRAKQNWTWGRARPRRGCSPLTTSCTGSAGAEPLANHARYDCPRPLPGIGRLHMSRSESGTSSGVERHSDPHGSWIVTA